jgi:carboxypeptidase Taq
MQDTHWASGLFGYFPSYALGNIYSGQLLAGMETTVDDWKIQIGKGNFQNVKHWLIENVHSHGNLYNPSELIKKITGNELKVEPFLKYLKQKYSQLYEF